MIENNSTKEKRRIPFDQPIKITLLFFHFIGFSGWYGGTIIGMNTPAMFPAMTTISGILLIIRELYKDGFIWLFMNEGALTIIKVGMLFLARPLKGCESYLFSIVMLFGILGSHLPKEVRERRVLE